MQQPRYIFISVRQDRSRWLRSLAAAVVVIVGGAAVLGVAAQLVGLVLG